MDSRPIGLFDSGVGGLSILRALQRQAPAERYLYFADTLWFPYGGRPTAEIRKRSFAIARRLLDAEVKVIVVACNTASAAALAELREAFPVPFVGMVPGLKPAVERSQSRRVAILATPGTLGGELYHRVAQEFGVRTQVREIAAHGLAEFVERGELDSPELRERVESWLAGPVRDGVDTVVLGCTHYNFVLPVLTALFPDVQMVDTSDAIARRVVHLLDESGLGAPPSQPGSLSLIVSGDDQEFRRRAHALGFVPSEVHA